MLGIVELTDWVKIREEGIRTELCRKVQRRTRGWVVLGDGVDYTCSAPHPPSASLIFCGGSMEGTNSRAT
jgi:hypothetical protein